MVHVGSVGVANVGTRLDLIFILLLLSGIWPYNLPKWNSNYFHNLPKNLGPAYTSLFPLQILPSRLETIDSRE